MRRRASYRARQRLDLSVRPHHLDCIGIRGHRPRAGRHCQAQVRKGHRPEVGERIEPLGGRIAGVFCDPLGGGAGSREGLEGRGLQSIGDVLDVVSPRVARCFLVDLGVDKVAGSDRKYVLTRVALSLVRPPGVVALLPR